MQKKVLFLGGSYFQLPPILYAKRKGYFTIVCDYLTDNPARQLTDKYFNVSTTDVSAVLAVAKCCNIDGIVAYASDPAAPTAAYVAERLSIPGNSFQSVSILSKKDSFREFLRSHQFNTPFSASFTTLEAARAFILSKDCGVMIKPVDASGSKGVSFVSSIADLPEHFTTAMQYSRVKKVIVEEFISRNGYQIAGDGFALNGKLVFKCLGQEHFQDHKHAFTPIGESFPLQLSKVLQGKIHNEIERLLTLLNFQSGALNFDILLNESNDVYLMEIGPRAGGNFISEVVKYSTGVDLAQLVVEVALGNSSLNVSDTLKAKCYASYIIHSNKGGIFEKVSYSSEISDNIVEEHLFVTKGSLVKPFKNSSATIGCLILKFVNANEMLWKMNKMSRNVDVKVR